MEIIIVKCLKWKTMNIDINLLKMTCIDVFDFVFKKLSKCFVQLNMRRFI